MEPPQKELLQEENKTLETLAQTIFTEWFVNFNFPGATGEMEDSELGEIPKGWRVGKLKDFGKIICGKTPSKGNENYFNGNIPFIKIPDLHNQVYIIEASDTLSEEGANSQKLKTIPKDSLVVSCIATVGLIGITTKSSQTNQQINSIVVNDNNDNEFVYYAIQSAFPRYLSSIAVQAVPIISKSAFELLPNQRPCLQEQKKIGKMLSLLDERIATQNKIIEDLKKLKSAIIEIE